MKVDKDAYLKFLQTEVEVPAGTYTRAHLLALATSQLDVPVNRLAPMFPELKLVGTADVVKAGAPIVMTAVSVDLVDDQEAASALPWEDGEVEDGVVVVQADAVGKVDDKQMLEALKDITWSQTEAPRGKPGLRHVFEVLMWLQADNKRILAVHAALRGDDFVKKPKPAKDLKALAEVVSHLPVWDSARWLFTVWVDHVSVAAFSAAWDDRNDGKLIDELWDFGLDMDCPRAGTEAMRRADQHSFMPAIISGEREDGVYKKRGSCAAVMKAMKIVCDTLPADKHAQMHDHIVKHYDADKIKAMAPLMKILNAKEQGEAGALICQLLSAGDVPVAVLAMVFQGEWDRLYTSLRSCLDTTGPKPPWLKASAA